MIFFIISLLLYVSYAILILAYSSGWKRYSNKINDKKTVARQKISILIPARNEAENVGKCLTSILANGYNPALLEILVIDDFSEDETASIARDILKDTNGRVLSLKNYLSKDERLNAYKKKALEIAIGESSGEWIITTDADCIVPVNWLREMSLAMEQERIQFIAAPVSFIPYASTNWLYYFQSLDFMTMQGITAASIRNNMGNMCNGANLAFRKAAFDAIGGYKGIDHIASGDDMLLMHKIQSKYPDGIFYLKSKEAIVETPAQPDWKSFLNQRIRWSSKADKYNDKKLTAILALVYFFNLNFLVLGIASIFNSKALLLLIGTIIAKLSIELIFLIPVAKFYRKTNELLYFAALQPLHILYIISAGFLGKFGSYQWKGRTVK
jgi:cellulose synthase/poly-beta-1,6-N-acetylglucosamine synthase-like glycosyltransferase